MDGCCQVGDIRKVEDELRLISGKDVKESVRESSAVNGKMRSQVLRHRLVLWLQNTYPSGKLCSRLSEGTQPGGAPGAPKD